MNDLFDSNSINGLLSAGFTWNVFNYGRLKNNIRFQDARFQQLLIDYQNLVLTAQAEVDSAVVGYLRSHTQAKFLTESAKAAERSVELSMVQYREGSIDFNQVVTTLTQQTEQQDALTAMKGTIATNLVSMYKALGGGWQELPEKEAVEAARGALRIAVSAVDQSLCRLTLGGMLLSAEKFDDAALMPFEEGVDR